MKIHLLNLDRSRDRLDRFRSVNRHLTSVERHSAIDGRRLDRYALQRDGLVAGDPPYTPGAIGCALSHRRLWERCVAEDRPLTVAEDDALFAHAFERKSEALLDAVDPDWDFIMWGYAFQTFIWVDLLPGIHPLEIRLDQSKLVAGIDRFQSTDSPATLMRMTHAYCLLCYSIKPRGAQALLDRCFPLRREYISFKDHVIVIENEGIDCVANAVYPHIKAYACVAPLVVSSNELSSTIR